MNNQEPDLLVQESTQPFSVEESGSLQLRARYKTLLEQYSVSIQASSTYLMQNAQSDIDLKRVYALDKTMLQGTKITPNIRARIRGFVMEECAKQWILRETSALACTYIDLYFLKKGYCQVQDAQAMAISCLMLARKQQEGKLPTISFNIFSKESLLQWEKKVAKKLEYHLLPPTHITYAQHIAQKWDLFTSIEPLFSKNFGDCESGINFALRSLYQQLDCIFSVVQSLKWELELLAINLFYLHAYSLNAPQRFPSQQLSNQEFIRCLYSQKDDFTVFFQKFLTFYSKKKNFKLIPQLGIYLRMFLSLKGSRKEFTILNSEPRFKNLRVWDKLQTYTKECYDLAKLLIEKIKRN